MKEIEAAIEQLNCKKAPEPDGVTNDMIKHFGPAARKTLLELFNELWKNGTVPAVWKKKSSFSSFLIDPLYMLEQVSQQVYILAGQEC